MYTLSWLISPRYNSTHLQLYGRLSINQLMPTNVNCLIGWYIRILTLVLNMTVVCKERSATWASYQIRNIAACACVENAGSTFTCRDACWVRQAAVAGKPFPAFLTHVQPEILPIGQDAHAAICLISRCHCPAFGRYWDISCWAYENVLLISLQQLLQASPTRNPHGRLRDIHTDIPGRRWMATSVLILMLANVLIPSIRWGYGHDK